MSFGGFSDITRDSDRAYSAGYKSLNRNDRGSENSGHGYDNGLSSGRYRQRQGRDSKGQYGGDSEQRESSGRKGRDPDEGDNNNEHRTRLDDDDHGECNQNSGNRDGAESQSREYGNHGREGVDSYSRGHEDQDSEGGGGLAGGDPSRILKSGVLAGTEAFGKAYEKSSNLNQERDGGLDYLNNSNRVENSAFGDRVENQESEIKKGGEPIGSVFSTGMPSVCLLCRYIRSLNQSQNPQSKTPWAMASKILPRKSRKLVGRHGPRDSPINWVTVNIC